MYVDVFHDTFSDNFSFAYSSLFHNLTERPITDSAVQVMIQLSDDTELGLSDVRKVHTHPVYGVCAELDMSGLRWENFSPF